MTRLLPLEELASKIRLRRKKHKKAVEGWLDERVAQPPCGCIIHWEWIWGQGDWILPVGVAVASLTKKRCKKHPRDFFDTTGFQNTLMEVLQDMQASYKLQVDDLEE